MSLARCQRCILRYISRVMVRVGVRDSFCRIFLIPHDALFMSRRVVFFPNTPVLIENLLLFKVQYHLILG